MPAFDAPVNRAALLHLWGQPMHCIGMVRGERPPGTNIENGPLDHMLVRCYFRKHCRVSTRGLQIPADMCIPIYKFYGRFAAIK